MGRKRKGGLAPVRPFCYYCNRIFDSEKVLVQHQRAKHFKCEECHKKMQTAVALSQHMVGVHKSTLKEVPNARPERNVPDLSISGMTGVPEDIIDWMRDRQEAQKAKRAAGGVVSDDEEGEEEEAGEEDEDGAPAAANSSSATASTAPATATATAATPSAVPQSQPAPKIIVPAALHQAPPQQSWGPYAQPPMPGWPSPYAPQMYGGPPPMYPMGPYGGFAPPPPPGYGRGMPPVIPPPPAPGAGFAPGPPPEAASSSSTPPPSLGVYGLGAEEDNGKGGKQQVIFVFSGQTSMEEKRSQLRKYQFDESSLKDEIAKASQSIQARLSLLSKQL